METWVKWFALAGFVVACVGLQVWMIYSRLLEHRERMAALKQFGPSAMVEEDEEEET